MSEEDDRKKQTNLLKTNHHFYQDFIYILQTAICDDYIHVK
jgi:hypothetical protein